jgi:flavodoxin
MTWMKWWICTFQEKVDLYLTSQQSQNDLLRTSKTHVLKRIQTWPHGHFERQKIEKLGYNIHQSSFTIIFYGVLNLSLEYQIWGTFLKVKDISYLSTKHTSIEIVRGQKASRTYRQWPLCISMLKSPRYQLGYQS